MTDLEPCPFCGGDAALLDYEAKYGGLHYESRCPQCMSCGAGLGYLPTAKKAVAAWNTRAPSPAVRERDAMREAVTAFFAVNAEFERRARNGIADSIDLLAGVQRKSAAELRVEGENAMQAMRQALNQEQSA